MALKVKDYWTTRAVEVASEQKKLTFHPLYRWMSNVASDIINRSLPKNGYILKCDLWNEGLLDESWFDLKTFPLAPEVEAVGVDISVKTCQKANKRTRKVMAVCADLNYLPFKQETFDLILDLSTLDHLPESQISRVLTNIRFTMKSTGHFFTIFHSARKAQSIMDLYIQVSEKLKHVHWSFGIKYFFDIGWLRRGLERVGFHLEFERPWNLLGWFPFARFLCKRFPSMVDILDKLDLRKPPLSSWLCGLWIMLASKESNKLLLWERKQGDKRMNEWVDNYLKHGGTDL